LTALAQNQIDDFCAVNFIAGLEAPSDLQDPPPLSELGAKNGYDIAFLDFLRARVDSRYELENDGPVCRRNKER